MSTLNTLFAQAAADLAAAQQQILAGNQTGISITVSCTVTSNQEGGFRWGPGNTNKASVTTVLLEYFPQLQATLNKEITVLTAKFSTGDSSGPAVVISAPTPLQINYTIELLGTSFTPETPAAGDNTGIVYGVPPTSVAGSPFFTLSFCNYNPSPTFG